MKKLLVIWICFNLSQEVAFAQTVTQTVKGSVTDQVTREELFGVTVRLLDSDPIIGTISGMDGEFELENVPVGRQRFEFRMMGYETMVVRDLLIGSGKEVILNIALQEETTSLDEVIITYTADKDQALNEMAPVSSRQFTVEETQRYAGGLGDPARLVSSFAGVASPSISSNGISVRGNSPSGLLWRIEGVEVPSPNHFADLSIAGAGILTALSSQLLDNSDFMTGAFPAEYGNATSGVFDMNLRKGNASQREHTAQIGILGVDFATEGPFIRDKDASYLVNYRYSTLALISPLLPSDAGVLKYQDLSYKIDLPTRKAGKFSLWGIGAIDGIDMEVPDSTEWNEDTDRENSQTSMFMFASGLNHKLNLGSRALLNSSVTLTGNGLSFQEQYVDDNLQEHKTSNAQKDNYKVTLQTSLSSYLGQKHFNKTGLYINNLRYNMHIAHTSDYESAPKTITNHEGQSFQFQFYSQSQLKLSSRFTVNAGFHSQYFQLNGDFTFEPRVSMNYQVTSKSEMGLAYGMHSKTESLGLYFIKDEQGNETNKDLELMKSHHFVFSYNNRLSEYVSLRIEPYFQYLCDIPVAPEGYVSTINNLDNVFFSEMLLSKGTGRNAGIDITLERYLKGGFYYLVTGSVFDAKYRANDGVWRNTRLNKNYVANAVIGKEWPLGRKKNDLLSANLRLNYMGGNRVEAIDQAGSIDQQAVVYGETDGKLSFSDRHKATPIWSFTVSYRRNKPNYSSIWSLQVLNSSYSKEFDYDRFNKQTQSVESQYTGIMIPNLSYKVEF